MLCHRLLSKSSCGRMVLCLHGVARDHHWLGSNDPCICCRSPGLMISEFPTGGQQPITIHFCWVWGLLSQQWPLHEFIVQKHLSPIDVLRKSLQRPPAVYVFVYLAALRFSTWHHQWREGESLQRHHFWLCGLYRTTCFITCFIVVDHV